MNLSSRVARALPEVETETDLDPGQIRSLPDRYVWVVGFVLAEVGLLTTAFVLDTLGGGTADDPGLLNVVGGLVGATAVLFGGIGGLTIILWGGYSVLQSRRD